MAVCIDVETYYNSEIGYTLKLMSPSKYAKDPRFECLLISVRNDTVNWTGDPRTIPQHVLLEMDQTEWVMHNACFDATIIKQMWPQLRYTSIFDTADAAVYFRLPRNLSGASGYALGRKVIKKIRTNMDGVNRERLDSGDAPVTWEQLTEYGGNDTVVGWDLYKHFKPIWPEEERWFSQFNVEAQMRGVPINTDLCDLYIEKLVRKERDILSTFPWYPELTEQSLKGFRRACRAIGISVPASLDKKSELANAWFKEHGSKPEYPWIQGFRDIRGVNTKLGKFRKIRENAEENGWMPYQMLYQGALNTGRFSAGFSDARDDSDAGGKINMLNLDKFRMYGCNMRHVFRAPKGYKLMVVDYAQIEAWLQLWRVGDVAQIVAARRAKSPYQAYAEKAMGWDSAIDLKKADKKKYSHAKVSVLQLGYRSGWKKLQDAALTIYKIVLTDEEAQELVKTYRNTNVSIGQRWRDLDSLLQQAAAGHQHKLEIELASGRVLTYFDPIVAEHGTWDDGRPKTSVFVKYQEGAPDKDYRAVHGGVIFNNEIQGTARDVLRDGCFALSNAGYTILWTVYDEYVMLVKDEDCARAGEEVPRILKDASAHWLTDLPMSVDFDFMQSYRKEA